jgi:two-component system, NarL family, nitrate/nitrite response regulator NarL
VTAVTRIRICIIEDHAIVRRGLKMLLACEPDIEVVGEAVDRKSAFEVADRQCPDLFLVDLQLGREFAVDFLGELMNSCDAKAVVLTGSTNEEDIHLAIQAGATGLVRKDEDAEVLIRAIRKVHQGEAWLSRSLMTTALSRLRENQSRKPDVNPETAKIASLTTREREIVTLVASGINRRGIAEKLCLSDATVRNHLTSIFGKLGVTNQFELVFYAQKHGLDNPAAPTTIS